uniref:NADH-ubiquinone oxidoreductase chain 1 n=1 Tax=Epitrimerus sabinae TaxID=1452570 RepID=A0A0U2PU07_9ACAR|nr:NADH dehydrogenase subunit 1 [Epitrimerus sabinae]ALK03794.1 NADH dehydrogenase subunit 1 [Epitrimerus sabinae]
MFFTNFLLFLIPLLISVAFLTLMERKLLSIVGFRLGPNKVSIYGFLQPISDAFKLMNKEANLLSNFSFFFYYMGAFGMLTMALLVWGSVVDLVSFKHSILIFMLILGLNSMLCIFCGWSTFSKYPLLGSLRTVAQLISYESLLYLCLFFFLCFFYTFNVYSIKLDSLFLFSFLAPICFYVWLPSMLAELNRTPYDFSEGESELVSGFNTEFGSESFTFIFLAEYGNIIFFCSLSSYLFFNPLNFFFFFFFFFTIWIRSVLPRYRFDKLMNLVWKFLLPLLTLIFIYYSLELF